jgi:hypothetical protein
MPLFVIYRPDDIPELPRVVDFWRTRAQRAGLPGLYLIGVSHRDESWDPRPRSLDASTMQALPHRDGRLPRRYLRKKILHALSGRANELTVWDYRDLHNSLLRQNTIDWRDFPLVLPNWDNTPRAGHRGIVLHDSSPALFSTLLGTAIARVQAHPLQERIIFLKAWNEWAEGNFVEPDVKWGHAWLESIQTKLTEKTPSGQD